MMPVSPQLVDDVAHAIQQRIASGEIPVGAWLRQERLAEELGVSRMPVREALRHLRAQGTVEIIRNRGARVRVPSAREITEVYEVRGVIEGHAAARAAQLITAQQLGEMKRAVDEFDDIVARLAASPKASRARLRERWHQANTAFHAAIVAASGNRHLADVIESQHHKIPRSLTWLALGDDERRLRRNAAEHAEILRAISDGDGELARSLVVAHATHACELLVRTLDDTQGPSAAAGG